MIRIAKCPNCGGSKHVVMFEVEDEQLHLLCVGCGTGDPILENSLWWVQA
jgi:Zn ribbon nucleic-acid-binding protein